MEKSKKLLILSVSTLMAAGGAIALNSKGFFKSVAEECTHSHVEHYDAVAPTTTSYGQVEHWACCECGASWADADKKQSLGNDTAERHARTDIAKKTTGTVVESSALGGDLVANLFNSGDKVKEWDQTNWDLASNGKGTGNVNYYNIDGRYAMYLSANLNDTQKAARNDANSGFSECRFSLTEGQYTSVTFDYKYYDTNSDTFDVTFNNGGNKYNKKIHTQAQFYDGTSYFNSEMDLINDNQWHSVTVFNIEKPESTAIKFVTLKFQHMEGEIYLSNMRANKFSQDIEIRRASYGGQDHGNVMLRSVEANAASVKHSNEFQTVFSPNTSNPALIQWNSNSVALNGVDSKVAKYISVDVFVKDAQGRATSPYKFFRVVDNGKGAPVEKPQGAVDTFTANVGAWNTFVLDASKYASDNGTLEYIGMGPWISNSEGYQYVLGAIRLTDSNINELVYSKQTGAIVSEEGYYGQGVAASGAFTLPAGVTSGSIVTSEVNGSPVRYLVADRTASNVTEFKAVLENNIKNGGEDYIAVTGSFVFGSSEFSGTATFGGTLDGRYHEITNITSWGKAWNYNSKNGLQFKNLVITELKTTRLFGYGSVNARFENCKFVASASLNSAAGQGLLFNHMNGLTTFINVEFDLGTVSSTSVIANVYEDISAAPTFVNTTVRCLDTVKLFADVSACTKSEVMKNSEGRPTLPGLTYITVNA